MNESNVFTRTLALAAMLAILIVQPTPAPAKTTSPSRSQFGFVQSLDAALTAGELRASSQHVARLYLESGMKLRMHRTETRLKAEVDNVETSLSALRKVVLRDEKQKRDLNRALDSLTEQWAELKPIFSSTYSVDKANSVYDTSEQMYIYSSKITFLFEDINNSEAGYMIDVAGKLQSNSERISKAAIHAILSRKTGSIVDLIAWKKEYLENYRELIASPLNDDYQTSNLDLGRVLWGFYDDIVIRAATSSDATQILAISKCSDGMWDVAQSARSAYVAAFKKQRITGGVVVRNAVKTL